MTSDSLNATAIGVQLFASGHGAWIGTGSGAFAAAVEGLRTDIEGMFLGTYRVRMTLELKESSSEWSGLTRLDIIDPDGKVIFTSAIGTMQATRITVEPLE